MRNTERRHSFGFLLALLVVAALPALGQTASAQGHRSVTTGHGKFVIDGRPVQIISGEMHPARIPRAYWRDRLLKARAMGLNAVTIYVFWNVHEPQRGVWDFSGQYDVAEFVRLAQRAGLYVILRPGPYVCAEWSFGGYPDWLLQDPKMQVRSLYPGYMQAARDYVRHLGAQLSPLLWTHGGPIIAVQVENEYGSYGSDKGYLEAVKQMEIDAGLGGVVMYTGDGPGDWGGTLPELPAAIDVGPGEVRSGFERLRKFRPGQSLMYVAEFYPGWFDQWGTAHQTGAPIAEQTSDLEWLLAQGYSVSLYMFHGGTDWGFLNGANASGTKYEPQTTSYDYAAPLDEAGNPTPNYYALRALFAKYSPAPLPAVPGSVPPIAVAPFRLEESASLWSSLPKPVRSVNPLHFEDFNLETGSLLYRTVLHGPIAGTLDLGEARDYAVVYVNGRRVATLDRRLGQHATPLKVAEKNARLDILVEDTGRINYGPLLGNDRKGLVFPVTLNGKALTGWENYPLRLADPPARAAWHRGETPGPAFHQGTFTLDRVGDTYLDVRALGKGLLWVNGHAVGRIWNIGPQQSDYIPGCWLHSGSNTVTVFDLDDEQDPQIAGVTQPVYALHAANP